jgi:hypothetical protein
MFQIITLRADTGRPGRTTPRRISVSKNLRRMGVRAVAMAAMAAGVAMPVLVQAESTTVTTPHDGTATLETSAHLDISINVPRFLFLQVGTGGRTNNPTIDGIAFSVDATRVGDADPVFGGTVTARVIGNVGTVTLKAKTEGALKNGDAGTTDEISFSQITVAAATASGMDNLPHPALLDGSESTETLAASGQVVRAGAEWSFSYSNSNVVAPGVYGGSQARNARVTYTATAL